MTFNTKHSAVLPRTGGQAKVCSRIVYETFEAVTRNSTPADKYIANVFRADKRLGSRDRSLVSGAVFSFFRWFGWLEKTLDPIRSEKDAMIWLLAAFAIESDPLPAVAESWTVNVGIDFRKYVAAHDTSASHAERLNNFIKLIKQTSTGFSPWEIIPGWAVEELDPRDKRLPEWLQKRSPMWIRSQTHDTAALIDALARNSLCAVPHARIPEALRIANAKANLYGLDEFKKGLFELQDFSSQCIGLACSPKPGEMWWDACAGGGGKSLQLASLMKRKGSILATDIREYKLADLKKRAARAAFPNIRTSEWNGKKPDKRRQGIFDGVLVDSPCSSSGRWRRNPDARLIARKEWVDELSETQLSILESASSGVKPGGVLVYATCSMFHRENRDVVNSFLERHDEFALEPFASPADGIMNDGTQQIMPWDADCDASFSARMRRMK